ncbi:hypothetical protein [Flavobacterium sp.]|uniref:hypothetical protein n=1 Tax=Flavobacterium sp. TaxID=239 RepID=UPI00391AB775
MTTIFAYLREGRNQFRLDPIIKNDTYAFLNFIPGEGSPDNLRINISIFDDDNILVDQYDFILYLSMCKKSYQEHYIGLQQNGTNEKIIFSAFNPVNNEPLGNFCIGVSVVKIKDGDEEGRGGIYLRPKVPTKPVFAEC